MENEKIHLADQYLIALRIIQPARVQDISSAIAKIWKVRARKQLDERVKGIHAKMREQGLLVTVRRGTYVLTQQGMNAVGKLMRERDVDNARLFLMKQQRKQYHHTARWQG